MIKRRHFLFILVSVLVPSFAGAERRTSTAVSLLETASPRAAALAGAATALSNDSSSLLSNPALLSSQLNSELQLSHQRGFIDDSFSQMALALPARHGGWGISMAAYDGGRIDLIENGTKRNVRAQQDLVLGAGGARRLGAVSMGLTGKFFSSELAETDHASAWALDAGAALALRRVTIGVAVQNMGTPLRYISNKQELPLLARAGAAVRTLPFGVPTYLLLDGELRSGGSAVPAVGVESRVGPLALRAGYRLDPDGNTLAVGTGFAISSAQLDYSFGLVDRLDSSHRVGVSFRFGDGVSTAEQPVFYPFESPTMTVPERQP